MTEAQVKELVKTKRDLFSSDLPEGIRQKAEFYIDKIFSMLSFETQPFAIDFLIDFFKFVYDLPASSDIDYFGAHHQQEFGLFLHSLEVCSETLKKTQQRTFIKQKDGVFFSGTYYTTKSAQEYVIFLTSLCHDIGKALTYKITNKAQRTIHKPFLMSLYDFKKQSGDAKTEVEFTPYDHKRFSLLLFCLLTKSDLEFLSEPKPTQGYSLDGIEYLFDILSGKGETDFGRAIIDTITQSDKISVVEYAKAEKPEYVLIKQFLQRQYKAYYNHNVLLKGEQHTAFLFPRVVKDIARDVLRIKIEKEQKLSGPILQKIISLLEEHIIFSKGNTYVYKIQHKTKQNYPQRRVILLNNDFFGSALTSLPENLSEWEILSKDSEETQQDENIIADITTEETNQKEIPKNIPTQPMQEELPDKDNEQQMYNYFKSIPIIKVSSVDDIKANIDNKRVIIFKAMQEVFPTFTSDMLISFLEEFQREQSEEEAKADGVKNGTGNIS